MFISSYDTYINSNSSDKARKDKSEDYKKSSESFSSKLSSQLIKAVNPSSVFPINYISDYKVLNNQQRMREDTQNDAKVKFSKVKAMTGAKAAYSDNSKIFSLLLKPATTIDQTPKIDKKMPQEAQKAKELIMRHTMVNTYIANENYYKITA
jgi:hypothetical protein